MTKAIDILENIPRKHGADAVRSGKLFLGAVYSNLGKNEKAIESLEDYLRPPSQASSQEYMDRFASEEEKAVAEEQRAVAKGMLDELRKQQGDTQEPPPVA